MMYGRIGIIRINLKVSVLLISLIIMFFLLADAFCPLYSFKNGIKRNVFTKNITKLALFLVFVEALIVLIKILVYGPEIRLPVCNRAFMSET